jgi:septal ring factor EnvC (AmiA/AmiB activator)
MTYKHLLVVLISIVAGLFFPVISTFADDIKDSRGDVGKINDPVQDAKQAYQKGIKEFVGIKLEHEMLTPGLKSFQEQKVKNHYRIRPLNKRWQSEPSIEQDPKRLHKLKRYANRYNLTMIRLVEQEELDQKQRYRY